MIDALPGDIFRRGQVLNNTYEIEGVLGRGGTGEVYLAHNLISGRKVAIKALNAQFSGQDGYIELMKREEQMRDIRDDAVVRYTECSRSDQGHVFLVMDFIDGPSMADIMAQRRMEPRELMIVAHRVAEGLTAAHAQGIVHRDLSPDNIILRDNSPERATIIDFGIAKDTAAGARTIVGNDFAGKYEYAAPEQLEGRAEPRSDLYALGALLLAAFRGQVPFAGATPGEMIRRKQAPLDTAGVPEPLKGLIDWLTQPVLAQRAPSATAVVEQLRKSLHAQAGRNRSEPSGHVASRADRPKKSGRAKWLVLPVLAVAAIGGAYWQGWLDRFLVDPLPVAAPYELIATSGVDGTAPSLKAHAPDGASAKAILAGFAALAGEPAPEGAVTLADGVPAPAWPSAAASVFSAASDLEDWQISLSDMNAVVTGTAPDAPTREDVKVGLSAWATTGGFELQTDIAAGPRILTAATAQSLLDSYDLCGRLGLLDPPANGYALGDPLRIAGFAPDGNLATTLQDELPNFIGDRKLETEITILNPDLCAVRQVLPQVPNNALSIWLGQGATGEPNLSGVFHKGDNPVVEVLAPATVTEGRLWVMVIDNTGKVFNLIPNINEGTTALSDLGTVQDGVRRVRALHSIEEFRGDTGLLAMQVTDSDFGKSEVIAILTRADLFDTRRPTDESVASFAKALSQAQADNPGNIIGVASRVLVSRP